MFAIELHVIDGSPVGYRQLEIPARQRTIAGELPSANHGIHESVRAASYRLSFAERQIDQEIPVHAMLRNSGVPAVEQQAVARCVIFRNCTRQVVVGRAEDVIAPSVAGHSKALLIT